MKFSLYSKVLVSHDLLDNLIFFMRPFFRSSTQIDCSILTLSMSTIFEVLASVKSRSSLLISTFVSFLGWGSFFDEQPSSSSSLSMILKNEDSFNFPVFWIPECEILDALMLLFYSFTVRYWFLMSTRTLTPLVFLVLSINSSSRSELEPIIISLGWNSILDSPLVLHTLWSLALKFYLSLGFKF